MPNFGFVRIQDAKGSGNFGGTGNGEAEGDGLA